MQRPKAKAVLSPEERWRKARALAVSMTPVSRMEGKPTLYMQRKRTLIRPSVWAVLHETTIAFVVIVIVIEVCLYFTR